MAVTKFHAPFGVLLAMVVVPASLGILAPEASAQDPRILSDITAGNRQVVFEFTQAAGDTLTPAQRMEVPDVSALVDVDLGATTTGIQNGTNLVARGAGGRVLGDYVIRVGNSGDFFKAPGPAPPTLSGFELAGAFQFGREFVAVAFTNRVNPSQALNAANYTFSPSIPIASVTLQDNGQTVIFASTGSLPASTSYTVTVNGVSSEGGEALTGSNATGFQTVSGTVTDIATIHADLANRIGQSVTVVGQVYIPAGSRGGTPSGYIQDGSGRGINLSGGTLRAEVDDRGNVVAVTGTVVDTAGVRASISGYTPTLLSSGQPRLKARVVALKNALDPRWSGTYIEVRGRLARIDRESDPEVPSFTLVVTDTLFGGYRIWRADAEDPDNFLLLRSYSLLDSTWTFRPGGLRIFADPDSIILRGTERDREAPDMLAGPFNGFGYLYSVTWFMAVVDVTTIPSRTTITYESPVAAGALADPVFPGNPARVAVPLLGQVKVVPNPYNPHASFGRGAFPGPPRIQFTKLPRSARVFIYTVSGDLVRILDKVDNPTFDSLDWNMKNDDGEDIAPGIYIYRIEAENEASMGRFVVAGTPTTVR